MLGGCSLKVILLVIMSNFFSSTLGRTTKRACFTCNLNQGHQTNVHFAAKTKSCLRFDISFWNQSQKYATTWWFMLFWQTSCVFLNSCKRFSSKDSSFGLQSFELFLHIDLSYCFRAWSKMVETPLQKIYGLKYYRLFFRGIQVYFQWFSWSTREGVKITLISALPFYSLTPTLWSLQGFNYA